MLGLGEKSITLKNITVNVELLEHEEVLIRRNYKDGEKNKQQWSKIILFVMSERGK